MPRPALPALLGLSLILSLTPTAPAPADEIRADVKAGRMLLAEGNTLADKGQPNEAVLRYKAAFERILPAMRGLHFKHEVARDVTEREKLKDFLIQELDEEMTPEEFRAGELGLKALGFIPREMDYKEVLLRVYAAEIAAFYDPRTKKMHLIKEPEGEAKKPPSFLERLLGAKGGFDKEENQAVIAHELTHALADQHYDLKTMQEKVEKDDDRSLALSAVIEGEATLTMMGAQMEDWEGKAIVELPAADLDRAFSLLGNFLPMLGGGQLGGAPPIIQETMMFPYLRGMVFCAHLANRDGWKAIDAAYRNPPRSTEQVLHPEKYFGAEPDEPRTIDLGKLEPGEGWKEAGQNVVGELQTAILLGRRYQGKKAAEGWDGDRYAVFEGPDGRLGLVWRSVWDTEDDAAEFARNYARFQTTKLGKDAEKPADEGPWDRTVDGRSYRVERRGTDVVIVEGFDAATTDRLRDAAFAAKVCEADPAEECDCAADDEGKDAPEETP